MIKEIFCRWSILNLRSLDSDERKVNLHRSSWSSVFVYLHFDAFGLFSSTKPSSSVYFKDNRCANSFVSAGKIRFTESFSLKQVFFRILNLICGNSNSLPGLKLINSKESRMISLKHTFIFLNHNSITCFARSASKDFHRFSLANSSRNKISII